MGEFDDVLAMEPGDEWDDYDPTDHSGPLVEQAPLVAALHAPAATLELRGQVPDELVAALQPLTAMPEVRSPHHVVMAVEIAEVDGDGAPGAGGAAGAPTQRWGIVDHERGELGRTGPVDELAGSLSDQLVAAARRADVRQQLLAVAAVRLRDGRGVVVVEPDRARRHRLVGALVAAGAGYLGADHVVAMPGSRTVLACPTPLLDPQGPGPADVVPCSSVDLVVVPDPDRSDTSVEALARAHGAARVLAATLPDATDAPEVVRVVASLAAGAGVWSVAAGDPAAFAASIDAIGAPAPRELVTLRRPQRDRDELVLVRLADGAALVDLSSHVVLEIDPSELAAVDSLGWSTGLAAEQQSDVLDALAGAGIDLRPAAVARGVRPPGPQTYGLPDAPRGAAGAAAWSAQELAPWASEPTVAAWLEQAARRGELHPDPDTLSTLRATAELVDARKRAAEAVACEVVDSLDELGVVPLVVGSLVLAHDGPAPAELFEVDELDLLVATDQLHHARQVLAELPGAVIDAPADGPVGGDERPASAPVVVAITRDATTTSVTLRDRLAAGPFGELVDHDELHDRAVPFRLGARWVSGLHPDDRFVLACVQSVAAGAALGERRDVVLEAPSSRDGMAAVLEASARWGSTRTVLEAIRTVDAQLPGLAHWLVERATRPAPAPEKRRRKGRLGRR
jgi:hypothetical protein